VKESRLVNRQVFDLFNDPPWPTEVTVNRPVVRSPRPWLFASLGSAVLLISSMALPWFSSSETPAWTPFSHGLNLGWSPGTQNWGFLVLALAAALAIGIGLVIPSPRKGRTTVALLFTTALAVTTLLETSAELSVNPGPHLHADFGAWIGGTGAVVACIGLAVATYVAHRSYHAEQKTCDSAIS
jgi:hypothetical protein